MKLDCYISFMLSGTWFLVTVTFIHVYVSTCVCKGRHKNWLRSIKEIVVIYGNWRTKSNCDELELLTLMLKTYLLWMIILLCDCLKHFSEISKDLSAPIFRYSTWCIWVFIWSVDRNWNIFQTSSFLTCIPHWLSSYFIRHKNLCWKANYTMHVTLLRPKNHLRCYRRRSFVNPFDSILSFLIKGHAQTQPCFV
jgi:hypothetical protein